MKKISECFENFRQKYNRLDMNNVYIGVYEINNQESLFYRVDFDTYYDLKLKKNVSSKEIEENSLILCNDVIECDKNTEKNIIKLYDLDRIEKVSLSRVYIGSSYQVVKIVNREIEYYGESVLDSKITTTVKNDIMDENLLLLATSGNLDYADFINLENGDVYKTPCYPEYGDIYIPIKNNLTTAAFELNVSGVSVEKGKLLEKYREYKRR